MHMPKTNSGRSCRSSKSCSVKCKAPAEEQLRDCLDAASIWQTSSIMEGMQTTKGMDGRLTVCRYILSRHFCASPCYPEPIEPPP